VIYFNGDSWSTSYHVNDEHDIWPINTSAYPRWTNLVAQELQKDFYNESLGCGSNSRILDCVENLYLQDKKPELIILALTSHVRIHLPSGYGGYWNLNPGGALDSITGKFDDTVYKWYYANGHEELDSVYRYYKIVWNLNRLCKQFECPYLIVQAWDDELVDQKIFNDIETYVTKHFPEYGINDVRAQAYIQAFNAIAQDMASWNYSEDTFSKLIGPERLDDTLHPDPDGHKLIADYMIDKIKELV